MRISDWSSDVCSSDLAWPVAYRVGRGAEQQGLDEAALPHHRAGVALVVVGVAAGEAGELAAQRVVVRVVGEEIGRASCRETVCQCVDLGGRRIIQKKKQRKCVSKEN